MIWLASFPRSGNTFFRNILFEVYGLESSEFHDIPDMEMDPDFHSYPIVKTHLLPHQLPKHLQTKKSVYLIRDGRDALVSIAHHRKDIVAPGSNYYWNLMEAILAQKGSFFGGWPENVRHWSQQADIIIRYEDLIQDPIKEVEKLRAIMDLPPPDLNKVPTFKSQKGGIPKYGSGSTKDNNVKAKKEYAQKFYRRGKIGSHKDEMPFPFRWLFWYKSAKQMKTHGYH